jgi:D-alanyl-lipoteichoic acid acyltransferase DltB (MBOAT superfamily)
MTNFRQPYFARSIKDFWSRWHISLSTWFRDYVYIPLGGSRVGRARHYFNLLFVFALSGLWHGAAWTFVIWGILHGTYLVLGHLLAPARARFYDALGLARFPRLVTAAQILFIWLLVMIGWVFFRAASATDAFHILGQLARPTSVHFSELALLGLPRFEVMIAAFVIGVLFLVDRILVSPPPPVLALWQQTWFRWTCLTACAYAIVFFGVFDKLEFIYFQF